MAVLKNLVKLTGWTSGGKFSAENVAQGAVGLLADGAKAAAKGVKAGMEASKEKKAQKEAAAQMVDDTPDEPGAVVLYCTQCGKKITSSMKFCGSCGSAI